MSLKVRLSPDPMKAERVATTPASCAGAPTRKRWPAGWIRFLSRNGKWDFTQHRSAL
jgi:hypothetical protein